MFPSCVRRIWYPPSAHGCFSCVTRFLECFVDFALVVMSLVAFIIAAVCLDQPSQFSANDKVVYYTLPSFWATYSHTVCNKLQFNVPWNSLY